MLTLNPGLQHLLPTPKSTLVSTRARAVQLADHDLSSMFEEQWINSGLLEGGATVVILRRDGTVYRHHFGAHQPDSVFCVHSMTKMITSIACLQLAERGLLSLDDLVADHLPSFRGEHAKITLRMCLAHTSGLDYHLGIVRPTITWDGSQWREALRYVASCLTRDLQTHVNSFTSSSSLRFTPGTMYNYADGANIGAAIVEVVSGVRFADYVREHITCPLGMVDTTFVTSRAQRLRMPRLLWDVSDMDFPGPAPLRLLRHIGVRKLRLHSWLFDFHLLPHQVRGDAGLKSTADDWTRLLQALLANGALADDSRTAGARLLSAVSVDELCRSVLPDGTDLVPPYALDAAPASSMPRFGVGVEELGAVYDGTYRYANSFQGQGSALGVNVVIDAEAAGLHLAAKGTCWWHGVGSTFFSFNRERDLGCLVLGQNYVAAKRLGALASVINAAHQLDEGDA